MTRQLTDLLSFQRIVHIPFDACMAALESWQLTGHGGELRLGKSVLRGPAERDPDLGTCRIEVRLDTDYWSATATALELIPCQRVRPSAAYFQAGHDLLDCLTRALPARGPARQRRGIAAASTTVMESQKGGEASPRRRASALAR